MSSVTKIQSALPTQPNQAPTAPSSEAKRDAALSKSVAYYESKSRSVHGAILDIWSGVPFLDVAKKYNKTPDALATAVAVFGKQAIDLAREKGVFYETAYLAMGFNKDGYDDANEMSRALPRAIGIKRDEGIVRKIAEEKAEKAKGKSGEGGTRGQRGTRVDEAGMRTVSYGLYGGTGTGIPLRPRGGK